MSNDPTLPHHPHDHDHSHSPRNARIPMPRAGRPALETRRRAVIAGNQLDRNTAQTPGMDRRAAINFARVGAQKQRASTVTIHADAKTGAHHHGHLESVIYVIRGKARMRWGERLEFTAEARAGRLHLRAAPTAAPGNQRRPTEVLERVLCRSDGEAVAVNLDISRLKARHSALGGPDPPAGGVQSTGQDSVRQAQSRADVRKTARF